MKSAGYLRVSTESQTVENQRGQIEAYITSRGWTMVQTYEDIESGAVAGRNGLTDMLSAASRREFDVVVMVELSRLSRGGIGPTFSILGKLKTAGVGLVSLREPWANTAEAGPIAELMLSILAWAASEERRLISERTKAAMARLKAIGAPRGRPKGARDKKPRNRRYAKVPAWEKGVPQ